MPLTADVAEKLGFVNHVVEEGEALKKAKGIAEAIIKNEQGMVLRIKSVINDGLKLDLGHALTLEKVKNLFNLSTRVLVPFCSICDLRYLLNSAGASSRVLQWDDKGTVQEDAGVHSWTWFQETFFQVIDKHLFIFYIILS